MGKLKKNLMKERQSLIQQRNTFNIWYASVNHYRPLTLLKLNMQSKKLELQERKALTFKDQLKPREVQLTSAHRQLEQKVINLVFGFGKTGTEGESLQ